MMPSKPLAIHPEDPDPWAHRSEMMRCATCMWHAPKANGLGRCRRHAPELGGWPAVFSGLDWCGDHKLDEKSLLPQISVDRSVLETLKGVWPNE